MRNLVKSTIGLVALLALTISLNAAKYEWTFQSSDQPGDPAFKFQQKWAEHVMDMSNGRIKIALVGAGSVVEHSQTLEAVGSGILQGDLTDPSYFSGKDPAFALFGNLIGAWGQPEDLIRFMYYGGGFEVANKLLNKYDVELLGVSTVGSEAFVSKKPIKNIADLKGVKMRAPEGMVQNLFKNLGAAPVNLPGSEVYTSLEKGVIDAADYSIFARNQSSGMNDIAKYPIYPGWHSTPANQVTINKKLFDSLPKDLQAILKNAGKSYAGFFRLEHENLDRKSVKQARDKGVQIISWNSSEIAKVRAEAAKLWKEFSKKSPAAKEYYETVITYLKQQGML